MSLKTVGSRVLSDGDVRSPVVWTGVAEAPAHTTLIWNTFIYEHMGTPPSHFRSIIAPALLLRPPLLKATSRGLLTRGAAACHTRQLTRPIRGAALRVTRGAAACHTRQLEAIIPPHCRADCAAAACEQYHNKQQWRYRTVYTGNSVMLQAAFSAWSEKIDRNREMDGGGRVGRELKRQGNSVD